LVMVTGYPGMRPLDLRSQSPPGQALDQRGLNIPLVPQMAEGNSDRTYRLAVQMTARHGDEIVSGVMLIALGAALLYNLSAAGSRR